MSQTISICNKKKDLLAAYTEATEAYAAAVAEQRRVIGIVEDSDYDLMCRTTERLRTQTLAARKKLNDHVAIHLC